MKLEGEQREILLVTLDKSGREVLALDCVSQWNSKGLIAWSRYRVVARSASLIVPTELSLPSIERCVSPSTPGRW